MNQLPEGMALLSDGSLVVEEFRHERYSRDGSVESPLAEGDTRFECERDVGRLRYSTALLRLGGVSQVTTPLPQTVRRHNRLTHTLKVAGLAREIGNDIVRRAVASLEHDDGKALENIRELGGLDVAACEAGGLAHDLGHAPFAHTAEPVIDSWMPDDSCGFEGNAQSLRIVGRLEPRRPGALGLGLCAVTLAASAKYPWTRDRNTPGRDEKFSFYRDNIDLLEFAQMALPPNLRGQGLRTLEASIVDLADDITYAVHDVQDFVESGLLDLRRTFDEVQVSGRRRAQGLAKGKEAEVTPGVGFDGVSARIEQDPRFDAKEFSAALLYVASWLKDELLEIPEGGVGAVLDVGIVRRAFSHLIATILSGVSIDSSPLVVGAWAAPTSQGWHRLQVMKLIGRYYVVESPDVVYQERAHAAAVERVLSSLLDWCLVRPSHSLPDSLQNYLRTSLSYGALSDSVELRRAIVDYICTL